MLRNRFMRLLTLVLIFVALILPSSLIEIISTNNDWTWKVPDGIIFIGPIVAFAVCLVGQLFGDIMNVDGLLNNGLVTFLKRVAFFIVVLGAILVGTGLVMSDISEMVDIKASVFEIGLCLTNSFAPLLALLSYVIGYVIYSNNYHDAEQKKWLPFFLPISYFGGMILGIIFALVFSLLGVDGDGAVIILTLINIAVVVVAFIVCGRTGTWPFEEDLESYSSGYSGGYGSSYGGYSEDKKDSDSNGCCLNCAYHRTYTKGSGVFTYHYCSYHGKDIEGMMGEYGSCSNYQKRY